ncbi:response regulator, partial [Candidatus Poribacteria bacterium]|nr:response regulator [Candidatus Poribacteria bacterium]
MQTALKEKGDNMENTNRRIIWINTELSEPLMNTELKPYVRLLEFNGYDVTFSSSSDDATVLLKNKRFDAVLVNYLDLSTRDYGTVARIRREDPHIPIVLLTDTDDDEIQEVVSLYNVSDVMIMPTNPRQVVSSIGFLLDKQQMRDRYTPQAYVKNFNRQYSKHASEHEGQQLNSEGVNDEKDWQIWIDTYLRFVEWDFRLDALSIVDELKT